MSVFEEADSLLPREEYEQLKLSGYFGEWFPTYTWNWKDDCVPFLEWKEIIKDNMSPAEKLRIVFQHKTQEEIQADWDETCKATEGIEGPTIEEYFNGYHGYSMNNLVVDSQFDAQIIYEALYCCDIHDSSYATLSIHRTRKGAERAIENHKAAKKAEFDDLYYNPEYPVNMIVEMKYDDNQAWTIRETELLD